MPVGRPSKQRQPDPNAELSYKSRFWMEEFEVWVKDWNDDDLQVLIDRKGVDSSEAELAIRALATWTLLMRQRNGPPISTIVA